MSDQAPFLQLLVAGVDGSDGAQQALAWTARLAATTGAAVLAVHVLTYNRELMRDLTLDTTRTWRRDLERDVDGSWIDPLSTTGVEHRTLMIGADSPAEGLLDVAEHEHADVVIVGSKGQAASADVSSGPPATSSPTTGP